MPHNAEQAEMAEWLDQAAKRGEVQARRPVLATDHIRPSLRLRSPRAAEPLVLRPLTASSNVICSQGVHMDVASPGYYWRLEGETRVPVSDEVAAAAGWDVGLWASRRHMHALAQHRG